MQRKRIERYASHHAPRLRGVSPLLARIYAHRGIVMQEELNYQLSALLPFGSLAGVVEAADRLARAIVRGERILIVGDYDVDGATSVALCVQALVAMGATDVRYLVPNRFAFGYGLSVDIVELAREIAPAVIVTVDNGISSIDGVALANELGIDVLVTDHHLPGDVLPAACAIVNPNQPACTFPSKSLAGVGVAFYVMMAVRAHLREQGYFASQCFDEPNLANFLDLVALGTVADVVRLDHNNRILVEQGLRRIRSGLARPGIAALLKRSYSPLQDTTASDLAFTVAPRLNAAGRLDDMSLGVQCLMANSENEAAHLVEQLEALNTERQSLERGMQQEAGHAVARLEKAAGRMPLALCLYDGNWHQGICGLLASRVREQVHRPVFIFAPEAEGSEMLKGSGRSIRGVHLRDALANIAAAAPALIPRFGGHAMAAGLSLPRAHLTEFEERLQQEVERWITDDLLHDVIHSDGELATDDLVLSTAELLQRAGPWGQGFEAPVFDGIFDVLSHRIVGEVHLKWQLGLAGESRVFEAIYFRAPEALLTSRPERVRIAYQLDVNTYRDVRSVQQRILYAEPV